MKRRMSYRLPKDKFDLIKEKLADQGIEFEDFIDKTIDLYLNDKLDPKEQVDDWGKWMSKK